MDRWFTQSSQSLWSCRSKRSILRTSLALLYEALFLSQLQSSEPNLCDIGLGPVLGSLLAVGFYKLMKSLKYEEVNGDQDKSAYEEQFMPKEEVEGDVEKAGEQRRNSHRSSHSQHRSGSRVANTDRTLAAESSSSPHRYAARNSGGDRPIEYEGGDHPEPLGNGNSHRNSRAYVPEPAGLQYEEKLSRRDDQLAPTLPRTANGEPYIQHTDAQIRGIRRSSQRRHQRRLG